MEGILKNTEKGTMTEKKSDKKVRFTENEVRIYILTYEEQYMKLVQSQKVRHMRSMYG